MYSQQPLFTKDDSIRGSITPAREWWDLTFYDLHVKVEPTRKYISGQVQIYYKVIKPYQILQIDLQPPLIPGKIIQGNEELEYAKEGLNAYLIKLKKLQKPGQVESILIHYEGIPLEAINPPWEGGLQWVRDRNGNDFVATSCQGLGASVWWPCKDHMYDEPDSMLMRITAPQKLMDISNGRLRSVIENSDSTRTFNWFVSNPINNYGVNMNVADYVHFADTLHGEKGVLDMDFYVLPYNLEAAKKQFSQAKKMLKAFEYWFGPYPFYEDGYKIVETPYLGMEHQSSVTYGNQFRNGYLGRDLSGSGWGLKWDYIIIHESGHEWFANNITYKDIADMWIHEGLTTYSETLYTEYYFGIAAGNQYNFGIRQNVKNDKPIIGVYNVNKRGSGDMYPKGANMIHTIRHSIDDDNLFREILRGLNKKFYHQTVTTQQIENYISDKAGFNYSKVFDQYLRTINIPQLEYYFDKNIVFYRWTNCVDEFNLPLVLRNGNDSVRINPSTKWQRKKLKRNQKVLFNQAEFEKMYYLSVRSTTQ